MLSKSRLTLYLRVCVFAISTIHHVVVEWFLLSIDFTKAEDPRLWFYSYNKFNLITGWINFMLIIYYPISCYCDWRTLRMRNEHDLPHIQTLNQIRDFSYISLLCPTVMFIDTLFWGIWLYDRELLCPLTVDALLPHWTQHSMHTYSLVVTLLELVLVPRERPKDDTVHKRVTVAFICFYMIVCFLNLINGVYVYSFIRTFTALQLFFLSIGAVITNMLFYHAQWYMGDLLRGRKNKVV